MEKPEWTFWPTQYLRLYIKDDFQEANVFYLKSWPNREIHGDSFLYSKQLQKSYTHAFLSNWGEKSTSDFLYLISNIYTANVPHNFHT